jgi:hypothetical protein
MLMPSADPAETAILLNKWKPYTINTANAIIQQICTTTAETIEHKILHGT